LGVEADGAALGEKQRQERQEDEGGAGHVRGLAFLLRLVSGWGWRENRRGF
jgi:hypothetical protein